jgi:hypothetical protein
MKWLLTTPAHVDLDTVRREVESVGGKLESDDPVPLGEDEQVLYADGPDDLPERLTATPTPIKANPSSEMDLF